jgi:ABC-type cobalamin/Fe3+-siderophores transport system ATPase subunit
VHHDLPTAAQWFDRVALIDMRLVAAGPTAAVLTPQNLERTYAGRLDLLDERSRGAHSDDVVAGLDERRELRAQQQLEADVGRGEVDEPWRGHQQT